MSVAASPVLAVAVSARALGHRYSPGRGLAAVTFALESPGTVAITGANGSGKSTLLRIVAGLLRGSEGACDVSVTGERIPPSQRRDVVGFAAPELAFYDQLTVRENLEFAAEARGARGAAPAVAAALEATELAPRADDRVGALSSGLRQRLRLAFAVLHRPALLLLDEPGSHLDASGRAVLARLLEERRGEALVLLATNDEREWSLADQRIELRSRGLGDPA